MPSRPGTRGARWTRDASSTAPGTPKTTPSISAAVEPAGLDEVRLQGDDRAKHLHDVRAVDLHVLARPYVPAQVAERSAQEARPEVEAQHERGLGDGLEEQRAVAAATRVVVDLPDERGMQKGAKRDRDGRLGDPGSPRDLGPRDRRAGPDRLEDGTLVEVLRGGAGSQEAFRPSVEASS